MSRFFSKAHDGLVSYIPGEQPNDQSYIKLNTNELPFPPSPLAKKLAREEAGILNLYPDPECTLLRETAADYFRIDPEEIMFGGGSDDVLNIAFLAYSDCPVSFPDVTYGFYKILAGLHRIPYREIPVRDDFTIDPSDYFSSGGTVVLANPNAPSGRALPYSDIEEIVHENPENIVIIDEAYADFSGESAIPLIRKYDNLLIIRTLSKSGALAGGRLGFAIGNKELIRDLNRIRNAMNPFGISRMTMMAGVGLFTDTGYLSDCCRRISAIREKTAENLRDLGFFVIPSVTNFLLAKHPEMDGGTLYRELKKQGVLVRFFDTPRLREYVRISIGDEDDMETFTEITRGILEKRT